MSEKPVKKHVTEPMYVWNDCVDYLEEKYNCDLRNFGKTKFTGKADDPPYWDFWHWMVDKNGNFGNPGIIYLGFDWLDDKKTEPWIREIITMFRDEFGTNEDGELEDLQFWVSW